jgi:hypothetical protein
MSELLLTSVQQNIEVPTAVTQRDDPGGSTRGLRRKVLNVVVKRRSDPLPTGAVY